VKLEPVICGGVLDHFTADPRKIRVRGAMVHPWPPHHDPGGQLLTPRLPPCPNPYAPAWGWFNLGHGGQFMARICAPWQRRLLPGPGGSKQRPLA
jgi:hypothetical protein